MKRLVDQGDGNYFYIDSDEEARRVFVDNLGGTLDVIAKDVKIQVEWDPASVPPYRLVGYENRDIADRDFRNDAVDAGEVGAGHQVTALYDVQLRDNPGPALATVRIRSKAPGPESPAVERAYTFHTAKLRSDLREASRYTRIAIAAALFAEILRESPYMGSMSLGDVYALAKGAARAEYPQDVELMDLIRRARDLRGESRSTVARSLQ